jgi:pimeloyl-ACP methyl ester carboxylesterase
LLGGGVVLLLLALGAAILLLPRLEAVRFLLGLSGEPPPDGVLPPGFERLLPERLPGPRRTLVGRPDGEGPWPVLVLVHGITEEGIDDGRLVRLADAFRRAGLLTVVPEIGAMVHLEDRDHDEARLVELLDALAAGRLEGARPDRLGLCGISVGGGYALHGAVRFKEAGGRGLVALVLVGTPADIDRVALEWFRRTPPVEGASGSAFDRAEAGQFARNVLLRVAAPRLVPGEEGRALGAWLAETWRPTRPPPTVTTEAGRRVIDLVLDPSSSSEEDVREVLQAARGLLDSFSASALPDTRLAALAGTRAFLLHGVDDPLVPLGELAALARRLEPHTEVRLLRSRLVGHTEISGRDVWPHVLFLDDLFDSLGR